MRPAAPAAQRPLSEEEKKMKVMQILQQKREQFSVNILCNLCRALDAESANADAKNLVGLAVEMADELIQKLYPLPESEDKE